MPGSVELDSVSQYTQIVLGGRFSGFGYVALKGGQGNGCEDAENGDYYQYFYQRECLLHFGASICPSSLFSLISISSKRGMHFEEKVLWDKTCGKKYIGGIIRTIRLSTTSRLQKLRNQGDLQSGLG
ncbi:hypothetical protein ES703_95527 [subsurface metagenome]